MNAETRTGRRLERREEELKADQESYLRRCGWKWTCDTPGSLWLWQREYKGKVMLVSTQIALLMQAHFNTGVYSPDDK